jgi:hypothetical protein
MYEEIIGMDVFSPEMREAFKQQEKNQRLIKVKTRRRLKDQGVHRRKHMVLEAFMPRDFLENCMPNN